MKSSPILEQILRNDIVHFFYKRYDTHGFACSFVFRSFFKQHDMLGVLDLKAVDPVANIDCKKGAYVFLCDIDVTPSLLFRLQMKAKKIYILDSKHSTAIDLFNKFEESPILDKKVTEFVIRKNVPPIDIVWELVNGDETKPRYIADIGSSYLAECFGTTVVTNNNFNLLKNFSFEYDKWEVLIREETYDTFKYGELLGNASFLAAKNICFRNAKPFAIGPHKAMVLNANRELMDEVGILAIAMVDIAIVFEMTDRGYYYSLYAGDQIDVNFLLLFKHYKCTGFHRRAWFVHDKFIFTPKATLWQKIKGLFS